MKTSPRMSPGVDTGMPPETSLEIRMFPDNPSGLTPRSSLGISAEISKSMFSKIPFKMSPGTISKNATRDYSRNVSRNASRDFFRKFPGILPEMSNGILQEYLQ